MSALSKAICSLLFLTPSMLWSQRDSTRNPTQSSKPNIVLIMADDLGYEGIGCYGNQKIQTPNLDNLAANGLRFTDFHSNGSVCTPTRAALLTGGYQQRVGLEGVIYAKGPTRQVGLDTATLTLARLLKESGYATGIFGKWHLGYDREFNPIQFGFDEFYGYVSGNVDFHTHVDGAGIYDWWHNLDTIEEEGYVTDLITNHAIDFIRENRDRPFFAYVPHEAPHVPFQGRQDPGYRYPGQEFSYYGPVEDQDRAYREMIEIMDEGIGKILQIIRELNLEENTLIIFISDNGAEKFGHNGLLNGDKGSLLEGGHRVPAIAYWRGKISAGVSNETVMAFDWMPSILSLCEISPPPNYQPDGVDISAHLLSGKEIGSRELFWRYRESSAVRKDEFKLLMTTTDTLLFNLEEDLSESQNLVDQNPVMVKYLIKSLNRWQEEMNKIPQKTR